MRDRLSGRGHPAWLSGLWTLALLTGLGLAPASAQDAGAPAAHAAPKRLTAYTAVPTSGSGQYYVEFRSRYAWDYGHTFVVFGRVGERPSKANVAGLSPVGDDPTSWVVGHYVPVPAETGWTDGDLEDKYISARYRVLISKDAYDRVVAYIRELQGRSHVWSAELYNCNAFTGDIARFMGLKVPQSTLIYPRVFINNMRQINTRPDAPDTLVSDNVKEMQSPTRDGRAMINNGMYTAEHAIEETRSSAAAPPSGPTVTIGPVRVVGRTASATASAPSP
jgi:hypothetical protein